VGVVIRQADLVADRDEIIRFLYDHLTKRSDAARFDWLYLRNPCGSARSWLALDNASGRTLGVAAAFPRWIWTGGRKQRGWVLGDFCIEPDSRSLGPALQLQRACLTSMGGEEAPVWYDLPSRSMMAIYRRLGTSVIGNQIRYVKLNRIDSKVRSYIPQESIARAVSAVGNLALRLQATARCAGTRVDVAVHDSQFDDEFSVLDQRTSRIYPIRGLRTAEYLNWRYRQHPLHEYRVVVARDGRELLGYAVVETNVADCVIADLQAASEPAIPVILTYIQSLIRDLDVERLHAPVMEESPLVPFLRRAGFHARESTPVVAGTTAGQSTTALGGNGWCLMHGDRES
jgi:Acetyltransferase (GNAT) domain